MQPQAYTLPVFWDSLREESGDLERDRRSMEAPALPPHPVMVHLVPGAMLGAQLSPFTPCGWRMVEGEEWPPLSFISHSPCHLKIRTINLSDSLETPQCTPSILVSNKSHCWGSHSGWEARIFSSGRTHTKPAEGEKMSTDLIQLPHTRRYNFMALFSTSAVRMHHRKINLRYMQHLTREKAPWTPLYWQKLSGEVDGEGGIICSLCWRQLKEAWLISLNIKHLRMWKTVFSEMMWQ